MIVTRNALPQIFIQSNRRQMVGALVSAYALRRAAGDCEIPNITLLRQEDYPFFARAQGRRYLRNGEAWVWNNDDLQSFTPLRFMPPELMAYRGRALVLDPDVFAIAPIDELLSTEMNGHAIMCVARPGYRGRPNYKASSVMLLDCERLQHWNCERQFEEMFAFERDYLLWIDLELETEESIGELAPEWNHFDTLTPQTRILHNTHRGTQPWKQGLPIEFTVSGSKSPLLFFPAARRWYRHWRRGGRYRPHPDPNQRALFFGLLREAVHEGAIDLELLRCEVEAKYLRPDIFSCLEQAPSVEATLAAVRNEHSLLE
jgi:hypothetical protein